MRPRVVPAWTPTSTSTTRTSGVTLIPTRLTKMFHVEHSYNVPSVAFSHVDDLPVMNAMTLNDFACKNNGFVTDYRWDNDPIAAVGWTGHRALTVNGVGEGCYLCWVIRRATLCYRDNRSRYLRPVNYLRYVWARELPDADDDHSTWLYLRSTTEDDEVTREAADHFALWKGHDDMELCAIEVLI